MTEIGGIEIINHYSFRISRMNNDLFKALDVYKRQQCDSLLLGDKCGAHTFPYMDIHNETAVVEHEMCIRDRN